MLPAFLRTNFGGNLNFRGRTALQSIGGGGRGGGGRGGVAVDAVGGCGGSGWGGGGLIGGWAPTAPTNQLRTPLRAPPASSLPPFRQAPNCRPSLLPLRQLGAHSHQLAPYLHHLPAPPPPSDFHFLNFLNFLNFSDPFTKF